jgi:flagellar basal body rod protein FlgC
MLFREQLIQAIANQGLDHGDVAVVEITTDYGATLAIFDPDDPRLDCEGVAEEIRLYASYTNWLAHRLGSTGLQLHL